MHLKEKVQLGLSYLQKGISLVSTRYGKMGQNFLTRPDPKKLNSNMIFFTRSKTG